MRRPICSFIFSIFVLALLLQACDFLLDEYDIKVINDTGFEFAVYIDDKYQFRLGPGSNSIIESVESGTHTLDARIGDQIITERTLDLDSHIEWTIYVDTYDIKVINATDFKLSIYLDDVLQFELGEWDTATIEGVVEGIYAIDARTDGQVIADRAISVDQDIEWTIYTDTTDNKPEEIKYVKGFEGKWDSNWGFLEFKVDGVKVKGDYTHDQGIIEATLSDDGKTMEGMWLEAPSYSPPNDGGRVTFTLSDDGKSIAGHWWYGEDQEGGDWTGTKID